jgi:hypothetical protein
MKFLNTSSGTLEFLEERPLEYAILSHSWDDLIEPNPDKEPGQTTPWTRFAPKDLQVQKACDHAKALDIGFIWVDALCINQGSTAEMTEFVHSQFDTVWHASICLVHLSDVSLPPSPSQGPQSYLEQALSGSHWFKQAWTLQELVASRRLEVFDRDWNHVGTKDPNSPSPWLEFLSRVSHVDLVVLADRDRLFQISIGRRLSWAVDRVASRPEDLAYSLIGICGISGRFAARYGEGARSAVVRLQETILLAGTNDLSVLAWQKVDFDCRQGDQDSRAQPTYHGLFTDSLADFCHFAAQPGWDLPFLSDSEFTVSSRGYPVRGWISSASGLEGLEGPMIVLQLNASWRSRIGSGLVGIALAEIEPGFFKRADPNHLVLSNFEQRNLSKRRICIGRDIPLAARPNLSGSVANSPSDVLAWLGQTPTQFPPIHPAVAASSPQANASNNSLAAAPAESVDQSHEDDTRMSPMATKPDGPGVFERKDVLGKYLHRLVKIGCEAFAEAKAQQEELAKTARRISAQRTEESYKQQKGLGTFPLPIHSRKRSRKTSHQQPFDYDSSKGYEAETDSDDPSICVVRQELGGQLLACHFCRRFPDQYTSCLWEVELRRIEDVEQHLLANHRLPIYCPVCSAIFEQPAQRDQHIVDQTCELREPAPETLLGVSQQQEDAIFQLVKHKASRQRTRPGQKGSMDGDKHLASQSRNVAESRWFRIWEILFPDQPRPDSAFLDSPLEKEVVALRSFWRDHGPSLIANELRKDNLLRWDVLQEEATLAALHSAVLREMARTICAYGAH